uniref:Histone-lysine N-methyltransferase SETMAR n=1 Tax=Graphocephala atropunctata TaxID=36148 RepID=A0A1B6MRN8_9HEMI
MSTMNRDLADHQRSRKIWSMPLMKRFMEIGDSAVNRLTTHRTAWTLAPSDFHLFRYLKEFLGGERFDTDDEVKEAVKDWLSSHVADFYHIGIQKLVERYDKCLNKNGNYIKKHRKMSGIK